MTPQSKPTSTRRFTTLALSAAFATLAACSSSSTKPQSGPPAGGPTAKLPTLQVAIASITLADDCGQGKATEEAKTAAGSRVNPDREADHGDRIEDQDRACQQTTLQLQLTSTNPSQASHVTLRSVELLDDTGKVLGQLTARVPTRWQDAGNYVAWDQTVAAKETVKASWPLSAPAWETYGLSRAAAAGRSFQVRVTVTTDGNDQVVAGQATVISPRAILDPMIET